MPQSEHHKHALSHLHNVTFFEDVKAGRVGVLTTDQVKFSAMEMTNILLREKRISICKHMHSRDGKSNLVRLKEQFEIYSYQYKEAATTFQKSRTVLSGKVGGEYYQLPISFSSLVWAYYEYLPYVLMISFFTGCKDDIIITLQLGCYWTSVGIL